MGENDFYFGGILGAVAAIIIEGIVIYSNHTNPLKECAETYNVFECEYVAIPKGIIIEDH